MDWLNGVPAYSPTYSFVAPQLMWIKVLLVCAVILLALALLTLLAGWVWHLSWRVRLIALLPLVASISAGIAVHALHDTYVYWVEFLNYWLVRKYPMPLENYFEQGTANANHVAAVLGWIGIIVTGLLLALSLLGLWRLVMSGRTRQVSASLAVEP